MLFKVFVALATFTLGARAAPAQNLTERQGGGVYITTDLNWGGATAYLPATGYYNCLRIPDAFLGQVSSIGPDPGVSCSALLNYDSCGHVDGHPTIGIQYPGISTEDGWAPPTAGEGIASWNDVIVGLDCINENASHGEGTRIHKLNSFEDSYKGTEIDSAIGCFSPAMHDRLTSAEGLGNVTRGSMGSYAFGTLNTITQICFQYQSRFPSYCYANHLPAYSPNT